jgi:hypothetical protein
MPSDQAVFAAPEGQEINGTYFLSANSKGGGAPVANLGDVTAL